MYTKRKKYYHKTIVVKDLFSGAFSYMVTVVLAVGILVSVFSKFGISPSRAYVMSQFSYMFPQKYALTLSTPTIYSQIAQFIPSVKSSEEMMKKYSAKYGGVKKDTESKEGVQTEDIKIKSIDMAKEGITFRNETAYTPDVATLLKTPLSFSENGDKPRVLIMHTHTSEAYSESENARATDNQKNVVRIGSVIEKALQEEGISVVHDLSRNDYPAYNGSYTKALACIKSNIEKNPSIEVVLDVHRDYAEQNKDGEKIQLKPVCTIDEKQVAQVMLVVGTDALGLSHPDWKHNLAFAVQIQEKLNQISPKIARPINLRRERFNQHVTKGSLILEMGTAGNTVEECENAGVYVGRAIAAVLKKH